MAAIKYLPNAALRHAAIRLMNAGLVTCAEVARSLNVSRVTANRWGERAPGRFAAREKVIAALIAAEINGHQSDTDHGG